MLWPSRFLSRCLAQTPWSVEKEMASWKPPCKILEFIFSSVKTPGAASASWRKRLLLQEVLHSSSNLCRVYRRSHLGMPRQTRGNLTFIPDSLVYSQGLERRGVFISQCAARTRNMQREGGYGEEWEVCSLDVGDVDLRKAADGVWSNKSNVGLNWRDETVRYTLIGQLMQLSGSFWYISYLDCFRS